MICSFKGLLIIQKIFSEYFGHISFGKINSGNIFYLIRRVNHDCIMMEDHYLLYGLFLSWGKLYIGPQKNTKKLRVFCVFPQDGSNKPCSQSSPPNPANVELLWDNTGIRASVQFPGSNPENLVKMAKNTVNTSELLMLKALSIYKSYRR